MSKFLLYKILFYANIIISFLLILFIFLAKLSGMHLALAIMMAVTGIFGAISLRRLIRNSDKS
jgi:hypothetical protein